MDLFINVNYALNINFCSESTMKNKSGYRPWVARKAPLFNTALNETYIKVSAIFPIVVISLLIGATAALASKKSITSLDFFVMKNSADAPTVKVAGSKPVQVPVKVEPVIVPAIAPVPEVNTTPNLAATNSVMVPEIPMFNSSSVNKANNQETK